MQPQKNLPPDATANIIAKTIEYLSVPCVVGHEQPFLAFLQNEYEALGLRAIRHEGLVEIHGKKPYAAILCAHADRHGLVSIGHGEYVYAAQYMKEIKYGQNNRASQKEIEKINERFEGEPVIAYASADGKRLGAGTIKACDASKLKGDALFEVDGLEKVALGTPIAYARTGRMENGHFKGQLDNAISLGIVHALFCNGFEGTALLTTEEEIGKSWTHIAAWLLQNYIRTQNLLVLDTSPYNDPAPVEEGMLIFRNRDMSGLFDIGLTGALKKRAEQLGLPHQVKDEYLLAQGKKVEQLGSTELGKLIQGTKGQWSGATVQIPTLMYHTSNETTSITAINNYYRYLCNILMEQPLDFRISMEPDEGNSA